VISCLTAAGKGSSSFLKKRTKKLLFVTMPSQASKSFLFLFFKKEILPCFSVLNLDQVTTGNLVRLRTDFTRRWAGIGRGAG
jgi:hypothetical protein